MSFCYIKYWLFTLWFFVSFNVVTAQSVGYELADFQFINYVDTLTPVGRIPPEERKQIEEVIRVKWQDTTKYWSEGNPIYQAYGSPLLVNGILFAGNSSDYVYDALTGEKLYYGTEEAKARFDSFENKRIGLYTGNFNIMTGEKFNIGVGRGFKYPWFIESDDFVGSRYERESSTRYLERVNIGTKEVLWSVANGPSAGRERTVFHNEILYIGDKDGLHAVNYDTGEIIWKLKTDVDRLLLSGNTM